MKSVAFVWGIAALGLASSAQALTVIDFDGFSGVVTNQYAEAVFSSSVGSANHSFAFGTAHSGPNILCTGGTTGGIDCLRDTYIDFTNPVNDLTFWAIEANVAGVTAQFNVFTNGSFAGTADLVSSGGGGNNEFVDLSAFSNITRLEIVNILDDPNNENGIGWDTFSFNVVPAPSSAVLLAIGGIATGRRRR